MPETSRLKKILSPKAVAAIGIVTLLSLLAAWAAPDPGHAAQPGPWYSVIPPLVAVTAAIVTGRIIHSLLIAVVVGGLLNTVPAAPVNPIAWGEGGYNALLFVWRSITSGEKLYILAFVVLVLSTISVIISSGGMRGIVLKLERFAKGRRSAQWVAFFMGLAVFIDDYANTMIVGSSVRPLTDRYRVSREKLSFLVDCTSAPVAGLAIMSTWVGYEVGLFNNAAVALSLDTNGYGILFDVLIFRFYCVFMLLFVVVNLFSGKEFGPMRTAEIRAQETGALNAEDAAPMTSKTFASALPNEEARVRAMTGLVPIGALFAVLLGSIWVAGGGRQLLADRWWAGFTFTAWRDVIGNADSIPLLALSAGVALIIAAGCGIWMARVSPKTVGAAAFAGVRGSLLPVSVLVLAWSLNEACESLSTGEFLVAIVGDSISPYWFPAITFVIAGATAFCTGTSWGTMAILMPIAAPIAFHLEGDTYGLITMMCFASVLDGAIWGDHCSPISDTTVMSSIACSADHIHHVRTQLPYSIVAAGLALTCGYIPAAFGVPSWACVLFALLVLIGLFMVLPSRNDSTEVHRTSDS